MSSAPLRDPNQVQAVLLDWLKVQRDDGVQEVWSSHVLGAGFEQALSGVCDCLGLTWCGVRVNDHALVHSLYDDPSRLGQDRWAAMLAAASLLSRQPCEFLHVLVSMGTATTIDAMVHQSLLGGKQSTIWGHLGGYIIPGVQTMLSSLHTQTVQLPEVELSKARWPVNTQDAIGSGVAQTQAAMIARCMEALRAEFSQEPVLWLSGGHAEFMRSNGLLPAPAIVLHEAVLRGVWVAFAGRWEGVA